MFIVANKAYENRTLQAVEKVRRTFSTPSQYLDFLAALLPDNLPLRGANACWRRLFAGI
ncbi:hypothetical protein [Dysosmobacter sp.]|uniref:hypothetical protein n=1 Tax=Dysosmobacter sp. TaxID=2591382 RepID=UPI002A8ED8CB|nr:hypothetical protein [Dysosmobacter sp.]MDY3985770.1 hypothetical protein [Dysosmobacter sp.]